MPWIDPSRVEVTHVSAHGLWVLLDRDVPPRTLGRLKREENGARFAVWRAGSGTEPDRLKIKRQSDTNRA